MVFLRFWIVFDGKLVAVLIGMRMEPDRTSSNYVVLLRTVAEVVGISTDDHFDKTMLEVPFVPPVG